MKKRCLYCSLQLPDTTVFCPQCGRAIEDAIRVEIGEKIRRPTIAKGCLHCGLQLPDSANFCPQCGRAIERGFEIRPGQKAELERRREETKEKDDLIRQRGSYYVSIGPLAHTEEDAEDARAGVAPKAHVGAEDEEAETSAIHG